MNVLAMMGRSKSGKDTVGRMIKELMGTTAKRGGVATLAFADRLKLLCMDLYGLTYNDVFTEKGKDRVTSYVCWKCPGCASIDCFVDEASRVVCRKCTLVGTDPEYFKSHWTVRMILQHVGTEGCRRVDPNVWVRFALDTSRALLAGDAYVTPIALDDGTTYHLATTHPHATESVRTKAKLVIVTDCRFRSEMEGVQAAQGAVWRLRRPDTDRHGQGIGGHASENEMDTIPDTKFQQVIRNDSTLDVLKERVAEALTGLMAAPAS